MRLFLGWWGHLKLLFAPHIVGNQQVGPVWDWERGWYSAFHQAPEKRSSGVYGTQLDAPFCKGRAGVGWSGLPVPPH